MASETGMTDGAAKLKCLQLHFICLVEIPPDLRYNEYSYYIEEKVVRYLKPAKKRPWIFLMILCLCLASVSPVCQAEEQDLLTAQYQQYIKRMDKVRTRGEIESNGFRIVEDQVFPIEIDGVGEGVFIPAYDGQTRRLTVFFADGNDRILFKTEQLETNYQLRGQLRQPNERLAAVSFQDMDGDGRTDVLLITTCYHETGEYAGRSYKVGDVLFQKDGTFYRDYRISEKINRYGMNKSIQFLAAFVRDGYSTEFLYTATTEQELLSHGFRVMEEQAQFRQFEKLGRLRVLPGTYRMAEYTVFMIYLVNEKGLIVWNFQPMGDYENLYGQKGIAIQDINGDGLKDVVVLSSYSYDGSEGEMVVEDDYSVYYQQTAGFYEDKEIRQTVGLDGGETIGELVVRLQAYWGWKADI